MSSHQELDGQQLNPDKTEVLIVAPSSVAVDVVDRLGSQEHDIQVCSSPRNLGVILYQSTVCF